MLAADRRVRLHRLPLVGVERARLGEDLVGDADLAHVVERARVAQQLGVGGRHADLEGEPLAEAADALDVQPGLGVAPLDRHAEPLQDLDLGLPQLLACARGRARSSTSLSRSPRGAPALGQLAPGDRARRRRRTARRAARRRRAIRPASNASWAPTRNSAAGDRHREPGDAAPAKRRPTSGATRASSATSEQADQRAAARAAARRGARSRSRSPGPRRPPSGRRRRRASRGRPAASAPTRRPRRCGRGTALGSAKCRAPRRRRRRCGCCRAGRGSRSRRRRGRRRSAGSSARRRARPRRPGRSRARRPRAGSG